MSSEWRQITFGDFLGIQRGHDLPDQSRRSGNFPILGSFGITGFHDTVKVKGPGVTIGRSGASFGVAATNPTYAAIDAPANEDVGLRYANPTYATGHQGQNNEHN